jgi:hypothetical protein
MSQFLAGPAAVVGAPFGAVGAGLFEVYLAQQFGGRQAFCSGALFTRTWSLMSGAYADSWAIMSAFYARLRAR